MVLTAAQTADFFRIQMRIAATTVTEMATMGITDVGDLDDYDDDLIDDVKSDLRRPGGLMVDPNDAARQVPRTPFILTPVSCQRLKVAAAAVTYYIAISRPISASMVNWAGPLKVYAEYLKALKNKQAAVANDLPKVTRSLNIVPWTEAFQIYLEKTLGSRMIPLAYVTRDREVPPPLDALATNRPYGVNTGSVTKELIVRASHTHALFDNDNELVYDALEEALRSTQYSATLSTFKRAKNGRGAWIALIAQYVGVDKWQKEVKKHESFLLTYVWKGNSTVTLESFVNKHRMAFVQIQRCAEKITHTIPSENQRVIYLLDAIQCNDPQLQAALANVRADNQVGVGKMHNFELMAAYILPHDPVSGKRNNNKRKIHDVAAIDLGITKGPDTGVDIRFYKNDDWWSLEPEEREEVTRIRALNKKNPSNKGNQPAKKPKTTNKKTTAEAKKAKALQKENKRVEKMADRVVAALVTRHEKAHQEQEEQDEAQTKVNGMVISALNGMNIKAADKGKTAHSTKALNAIIGRTKDKI